MSRSATMAISMPRPARRANLLLVALQHGKRAATDGANAQKANLNGFHGVFKNKELFKNKSCKRWLLINFKAFNALIP